MKKLNRHDRRAAHMSSNVELGRSELADHLRGKNQWVLSTTRRDGRPQMSLVSGGMTAAGTLAIATYPERVKAKNARRNDDVSVLVFGNEFDDQWIQIDGSATVLDMPQAGDAFVDYFRCISGEHPDWDEYREAMEDQGKCIILIEPTRWGPLSKGGFPPSLFEG